MANRSDHKPDQGKKAEHGAEGVKGVSPETVGAGKGKDPNNFANDPERAREAGRKGGETRKDNS